MNILIGLFNDSEVLQRFEDQKVPVHSPEPFTLSTVTPPVSSKGSSDGGCARALEGMSLDGGELSGYGDTKAAAVESGTTVSHSNGNFQDLSFFKLLLFLSHYFNNSSIYQSIYLLIFTFSEGSSPRLHRGEEQVTGCSELEFLNRWLLSYVHYLLYLLGRLP